MDTPINTFQQIPILSNSKELEIPARAKAYFRARLSNKIHSLVLSEFSKQESIGVISKASLARRVGKKPEQITRWLGSSGNWTIETLSDLLLGMGLEPSISLKKISDAYSSPSINKSNEKIVFIISDDNVANKQSMISLKIDKYYNTINNQFNNLGIDNDPFTITDHSYKILEITK